MKILFTILALLTATALSADTKVVSFVGYPAQLADITIYATVNSAGTVTAINVKALVAQVYSDPSGDTAVNQLGFVEFEVCKECGSAQFADLLEGIVATKWNQQYPAQPLRERRNDRRSR